MTARQSRLGSYLQKLHKQAGTPTMRSISESSGLISHTSVHGLLTGAQIRPRWATVKALVDALGGDTERARALWLAERPPQRIDLIDDTDLETPHDGILRLTGAVADLTTRIDEMQASMEADRAARV